MKPFRWLALAAGLLLAGCATLAPPPGGLSPAERIATEYAQLCAAAAITAQEAEARAAAGEFSPAEIARARGLIDRGARLCDPTTLPDGSAETLAPVLRARNTHLLAIAAGWLGLLT